MAFASHCSGMAAGAVESCQDGEGGWFSRALVRPAEARSRAVVGRIDASDSVETRLH